MTASIIVVVFLFNLFGPFPPGIAINPETKECGYYFGGDEYASYYLPPPWEINYGAPIQIETSVHQWDGSVSSIEGFCNQIGYTYIAGNLGNERGQLKWSGYTYILLAFTFAPVIIIVLGFFLALFLFLRWANKRSNNASIS